MQSIRAHVTWPGVTAWEALWRHAPSRDAILSDDKTERRMVLLQWAVMPLVLAGGLFPRPRPHEPSVHAIAAAAIMAAHPLLYLLVGRLPALRAAPRTLVLTAADVTMATLVFYTTAAQPGYAQVLLYCAVALAATRYALYRACGIASLVALLLVFAALLPLHVALPTVAGQILGLYALTGLVGLLSQTEKAVSRIASQNALLAQTVMQRNRELAALNRLSHTLNTVSDREEILRLGLAGMAEALDLHTLRAYVAENGAIRRVMQVDGATAASDETEDGRVHDALKALRSRHTIVAGLQGPIAEGIQEPIIAGPQGPIAAGLQRPIDTLPCGCAPIRASVPLVVRDHVAAVIGAELPSPLAESTEAALETLQVFCGELAVALENALLRGEAHRTDILREKNRIAQELHDTVLQMLFSVGLRLQWSLDQLAEGDASPDKLCEPLAEARHLSARAGEELRGAIFTLSSDIAEIGLVAAVERLVDDQAAKAGWSANVIITGEAPELPVLIQNAAHRVVREALMNAYKHARATEVVVSARFTPELITLVVQDNGSGISDAALAAFRQTPDHFGLRTIAEQVENLGGALTISAAADEPGTTVKATIPVGRDTWRHNASD